MFLGRVTRQLGYLHKTSFSSLIVRVGLWLGLYKASCSMFQAGWLISIVLYVTTLMVTQTIRDHICFSFGIIHFHRMPNSRRAKHPGANST